MLEFVLHALYVNYIKNFKYTNLHYVPWYRDKYMTVVKMCKLYEIRGSKYKWINKKPENTMK